MELTLIPIKQVFYNEENNYRVLSCVPQDWNAQVELNKYGNFTLSGYNLMGLILNQPVSLNIVPDEESKYEASYIVEGYAGITFTGEIEVDPRYELTLLEQIMSKDQAKNVNTAYPNFVGLVLNNKEDTIDPKNIYNVGDFRLADYCTKIKENFGVFLFFSRTKPYNITDFSIVSKLYFAYHNPDIWEEEYKTHPYKMLTECTDWSFIKIDSVVLSTLKQFETSEERAKYCVYNYLKENETDGDTKIDARVLKEIIDEEYPELGNVCVPIIKNDDQIYFDPKSKCCGFKSTYQCEQNIATNILNRVNYPMADTMDWARFKNVDGYEMTDEQVQICRIANDKSIGMMIGCAGSGKTTATKALIKMLDEYGKSYILLAPTGIAAKKLRESTHRPASTIHMALTREDFVCEQFDYVIIDEMSCVGVHLLSDVFNNIKDTTKVIFICDNAQLASISCGNIVQDIINANIIPTTELTKIFRYGTSGIATIATNTRNGKIEGRGDIKFADVDYKYVDINTNPLNQVIEEYNNLLLNGYTKNDILILCPYNKSSLGTYTINEAIQTQYNTNTEEIVIDVKNKAVQQIHYKVGDRVINIHNNYRTTVADIDDNGEYAPTEKLTPIMNGDIGVIRHIDFIEQNDKGKWVKYNLYIQFDEEMVCFTPKEIKNLLLGYCISVHKSQGTQAKAIISVIGKNHSRLVSRNLLYVAVSRAQEKLVEIVYKDCVEKGLDRIETIDRRTWLGDLLH